MATYLEMLEKIQTQALENLKQVQAVQVATLQTARELVASLPTLTSVPTVEGLPTLTQITELNTSFAAQLLEQQKAYAAELSELFAPPIKSSSN
jgi:hypothetical protein